jgi:hypothetical protein
MTSPTAAPSQPSWHLTRCARHWIDLARGRPGDSRATRTIVVAPARALPTRNAPGSTSHGNVGNGASTHVQTKASVAKPTSAMLVRFNTIQGTPPQALRVRPSTRGAGGDFAAMSGDDWDDVVHTARWVAQWRELQRETFDVALNMSDANAQRHMLFVAGSYALLAERAEQQRKRLAILANAENHA